jgi:hypothetical protein
VQDATDEEHRGSPYWSKLRHIGVHQGAVDLRPELGDLGLDEVYRICDRAWAYSRADFEPSGFADVRTSQWRETCALAGSIAESLMLSSAAYLEAEWHSNAITAGTEPAGMAIAQRYLADNAIDTAVSVGHRLMNFVARVARTNPSIRELFTSRPDLRGLGDNYTPFMTEDRHAWLSLNVEVLKTLRTTIPECHVRSVAALDGLVTSTAWKALDQVRAENFHRWRKEHESVVGVDRDSGRADNIYDHAGNVIGRDVRAGMRRHSAADGMTVTTTKIAGAGVRRVAIAVDAVITDTLTLLPSLTGGFTLEIDDEGQTRRMSMPIF